MAKQCRDCVSSWPAYFCLLAVALITSASAQNNSAAAPPKGTDQSTPVFRSTSRLVLVDVVATDHQGAFVAGLKVSDFTVLEDG